MNVEAPVSEQSRCAELSCLYVALFARSDSTVSDCDAGGWNRENDIDIVVKHSII